MLDDLEGSLSSMIQGFEEQCRMIGEEDDRLMVNQIRIKVRYRLGSHC